MSSAAPASDGRGSSARESLTAPAGVDPVRSVYEQLGVCAEAVARVLVSDHATARQAVVDAFATAGHASLGRDGARDRRLILARVVALCEEQRRAAPSDESRADLWSRLARDQRVTLALALFAGCSLDEIAGIVALDRRRAARALTDALRGANRR